MACFIDLGEVYFRARKEAKSGEVSFSRRIVNARRVCCYFLFFKGAKGDLGVGEKSGFKKIAECGSSEEQKNDNY